MIKKIIILLIIASMLNAREEDIAPHVEKGNLAMPTSQQPEPLFSFGQNIVDKSDKLFYGTINYFKANLDTLTVINPNFLYGIRDDLSILFQMPLILLKTQNNKKTVFANINLQAEYAFYNKDELTWANQATIVGNCNVTTKNIPTAIINFYNATSFFLGITASHLSVNWYCFTSQGIIMFLPNNNFKEGNQFLYQFGVGRRLGNPCGWLVNAICECNGTYTQSDTFFSNKISCPQNQIVIAPSLFASSERLIFQVGIAIPVLQTNFEPGTKTKYQVAAVLSWKF